MMHKISTEFALVFCIVALASIAVMPACGGGGEEQGTAAEGGDQPRSAGENTRRAKGDFISVSAGFYHTCGIKNDNSVACWGSNTNAIGDETGQAKPPDGHFEAVSAGSDHTCGMRTDGTVACWGDNIFGQSSPPAEQFASLEAGSLHTCGLKTDGSVECWGAESRSHILNPPEGELFTSISAGYGHACGVRTDSTILCWGDVPYHGLTQVEYAAVSTEEQYSTASVGHRPLLRGEEGRRNRLPGLCVRVRYHPTHRQISVRECRR